MKYIKGFGYFWYDFLVGDSMTLAVGGVGALLLAYLVVLAGAPALAEIVLPVVVIATIIASLL